MNNQNDKLNYNIKTSEIQLVIHDFGNIKEIIDKKCIVAVSGEFFSAHTGYHIRKLLMDVKEIQCIQPKTEYLQEYAKSKNNDQIALEQMLNSWNRVMNNKDTSRLEYLYANELKYYGKQYLRSNAIKDKQRALSKYPEFSQQIKNISYEEITQNLYKVSFDKYVKASPTSQEKLYPSYLYIKKINVEWKIVEESDKVTDRILQEKAKTNTSSNYYIARISIKDHYNRRGNKLRKVADIIQQDRANFYKYGIRDSEDRADNYFFKKENRFRIRKMLQNGHISGDTAYQIINGTPIIKVEVNGNAINVSLVRNNNLANKDINQLNYKNNDNVFRRKRRVELNVPVIIGREPDEDACGGAGEIRGISRYGDGYVAVRSGPGTKYKIIDKIYRNGMHVAMCDTNGKWEGVVYGNGKCGTGSPVAKRQPYRGKCKSGWIYKQYVKLIAE